MLATLCSSPIATKAGIEKTIATTFSITVCPAKRSQTVRHTIVLHKIPLTSASTRCSDVMESAMLRARPVS